jgi:diketogulonate reductase-like aldo/keto reductase
LYNQPSRAIGESMDIFHKVELANGVKMPIFGLGVFRVQDGDNVRNAVENAFTSGYRCIDTASLYGNEIGVGQAIRKSQIPREEIFLTTKVWNTHQGYENTLQAFEDSFQRLNIGYIDLYLVHWPVGPTYIDTWKALEKLYKDGRVRAIGVSNFYQHHLEEIRSSCEIMPMVNQVELHPILQLPELRSYCKKENILVQAWAPIMRGKVKRIVLLRNLAKKYRKTEVQIALRWAIQNGIAVIPKSTNPQRIKSNANVFDFTISDDDMYAIASLDRKQRLGPHPDSFSQS